MRARVLGLISVLFSIGGAVVCPLLVVADDEIGLLTHYCYTCHSVTKHKGDFDLESLGLPDQRLERVEQWEKTREALADHVMPPDDKPQPSFGDRDRLVTWIDKALDGPDGAEPKDPGWVTTHRLTRREFNRTIHDLLGVDGSPADAFPADNTGGGGFDNNADTLFVSPIYMERMLQVALQVIEKAKPERLGVVAVVPDKAGSLTPQAKRKAVEASLTNFLPRAWRRPVTTYEVQALARIYDRSSKKNNVSYDDALRLAYAAALVSPDFLYRIEVSRSDKGAYALGAYELASRLSYFLWSTMPDEELMAAAKDGSLVKEKAVLQAQTKRMLQDPRARVFVEQFIGQWLGTSELADGKGPDPKIFPAYSDSLRKAMAEEPVAFLQALLKENGSLCDLIDCGYVYANSELASK